jgi:hypothetical protein
VCFPLAGSYRRPPCPWVVQAAVVAVFQAAGVGHTGGVVNLKPICVVGHPTAAELQQGEIISRGKPPTQHDAAQS